MMACSKKLPGSGSTPWAGAAASGPPSASGRIPRLKAAAAVADGSSLPDRGRRRRPPGT